MKKIITYCDKIDSTFYLEQDINCKITIKFFLCFLEDIEIEREFSKFSKYEP